MSTSSSDSDSLAHSSQDLRNHSTHNGAPSTNAHQRMVFDPNNPLVRQMIERIESSPEMREVRRRLASGHVCRTLLGNEPYYLTREWGVVAGSGMYLIVSNKRLVHSHLTVTFNGFHRVPLQSQFPWLQARAEPGSRTGASGGMHPVATQGFDRLVPVRWALVRLPAQVPARASATVGPNGSMTSAIAREPGSVHKRTRPMMNSAKGWVEQQDERLPDPSSASESTATPSAAAAAQSDGGEHHEDLAINASDDSSVLRESMHNLHLGSEHESHSHAMQTSGQTECTTRMADDSDTTMDTSQTQAGDVSQTQVGDASQSLSDMSWVRTGSDEHDELSPGVARRLSPPSGRNSLGPLPEFGLVFDEWGDVSRSSNDSMLHQSQDTSSSSSPVLPGTRRAPRRSIPETSPLDPSPLRSGSRSMELGTSGNVGLSPTGAPTFPYASSTSDHSGGALNSNEERATTGIVFRLVDLNWPHHEDNSLGSDDASLDHLSFPSDSDLLRLSGSDHSSPHSSSSSGSSSGAHCLSKLTSSF